MHVKHSNELKAQASGKHTFILLDIMHCARQAVQLADGRHLAFAVFGKSLQQLHSAPPVIYHHGWPSSCIEGAAWSDAAAEEGMCMVAVDRPGYGGSTFNQNESFSSYASDVSQLMHHLSLKTAIHMGTSGGGPYACACAALTPKTTAGLCLVASMTHCSGPSSAELLQGMDWSNRLGYNLIAYAPQLTALSLAAAAPLFSTAPLVVKALRGLSGWEGTATASAAHASRDSSSGSGTAMGSSAADVDADGRTAQTPLLQRQQQQQQGLFAQGFAAAERAGLHAFSAFLPAADRQVLLQKPSMVFTILPQALADSVAQGSRGLFQDMRLTTLPWGYNLKQIKARTLVFQGDADVNVTVAQAKHLLGQIPDAELHVVPGASHFSLVVCHGHQMLSRVKAEFMAHDE